MKLKSRRDAARPVLDRVYKSVIVAAIGSAPLEAVGLTTQGHMSQRKPTILGLVFHFIGHMIACTIMFVALFCIAFAVSIFVNELEVLNASYVLLFLAKIVEYSIVGVDIILYVIMTFVISSEFIKEVWSRLK